MSDEKKLTRQQQRQLDQTNKDASAVHKLLCDKFLNFFIASDDPEGEEVKDKARQVHAQWMIFCKRRNLKDEAFGVVKKYCDNIIVEYQKDKAMVTPKVEKVNEILQNITTK